MSAGFRHPTKLMRLTPPASIGPREDGFIREHTSCQRGKELLSFFGENNMARLARLALMHGDDASIGVIIRCAQGSKLGVPATCQ